MTHRERPIFAAAAAVLDALAVLLQTANLPPRRRVDCATAATCMAGAVRAARRERWADAAALAEMARDAAGVEAKEEVTA